MRGLLSPGHLLLILIVLLLFFGPTKLPELGRSLGRGLKAFRQGTQEALEDESSRSKSEQSNSTDPVDKQ